MSRYSDINNDISEFDLDFISGPKSNQLIALSNFTFVPSLMKFYNMLLELSRKRGSPDGHPDGRTDNPKT